MKPTAEQQKAQNRIHDLLAELADAVGPHWDGQAAEQMDPEDLPSGAVFLAEWVVMASWVDEDGEQFTTRIASSNLPTHHRVGLLHEGLYGFG